MSIGTSYLARRKTDFKRISSVLAGAGVVAMVTGGLLTAPGTAYADDDVEPKIVGGVPATESYPFMTSIQVDRNGDPNSHICGGSLIAKNWVETNAHCVTNDDATAKDPALYHVRVGSNDRTTGGTVAKVTEIHVYPTWDWLAGDGLDNEVGDIALLKLDSDIPVTPVGIASYGTEPGNEIRTLGWGRQTADDTGDLPTQLYQLDTTILEPEKCGDGDFKAGKGELCVDTPGSTGTCGGDSGSPAVEKIGRHWRLVGSTSRGTTDLCGDGTDVFTDVTYFKPWIHQVINGQSTASSTR